MNKDRNRIQRASHARARDNNGKEFKRQKKRQISFLGAFHYFIKITFTPTGQELSMFCAQK